MAQGRKLCDPCFFLPTRLSIMVIAIFQGGVLNYYLVHYNNYSWFAWIAGDVAVFFSFFVAFFISYRELMMRRIHKTQTAVGHHTVLSRDESGNFPLVYFAWLVYSVILSVRVALIYINFAYKINSGVFFGTNLLKFTLAMAGVVFLLLVTAHHNAPLGSEARNQINLLTALVPFDIIDCVDILSVLFIEESKDALEWTVVVIACINFVLPIIPLMMLSRSNFGVFRISVSMSTLHKLVQIFVINAPLLSVRILMWHKQGDEVSPLIVKNIVLILILGMDLYEGGEPETEPEVWDAIEFDERDTGRDRKSEHVDTLHLGNVYPMMPVTQNQ